MPTPLCRGGPVRSFHDYPVSCAGLREFFKDAILRVHVPQDKQKLLAADARADAEHGAGITLAHHLRPVDVGTGLHVKDSVKQERFQRDGRYLVPDGRLGCVVFHAANLPRFFIRTHMILLYFC